MRLSFFILLSSAILLLNCAGKATAEKTVIVKTPQDVNKAVEEELAAFLEEHKADSIFVIENDTLQAFSFVKQIAASPFRVWTDKGKLAQLGDSLFSLIKNARHYGLYREDYHFTTIEKLLNSAYDVKADEYNASSLTKAELLLYDGYLKFGAHVHKGRFYPDSFLLQWNPARLRADWVSVLQAGITGKNLRRAIDQLEPQQEGYRFLRDEFRKYIYDKSAIEFDSIPLYAVKDSARLLKQKIIERFKVTGEWDSTLTGNDSVNFVKAMKRFQKNWHLEPDGKIGKLTRQALQYNREKVIRQMEMALERWRWEEPLPKVYFWVNIPSFTLRVMEEDTLVIKSNVVCGKPETPTPLLKSRINFMLIYPYWNVPYSIAWKEILPAVQRDTSYLRKKNMEVIGANNVVIDPATVKWRKYNKENLPFRFRQTIGEDNSLGVVKFNFHNKYGVYLHDTNSKRYFKTAARSQSHGCIRVEKYLEVARFLIRDDTLKIPIDTLDAYLATPFQRQIDIKKKPAIYVKYFTAEADTIGNLQLYLDIYRKDEKMADMIYKRRRNEP